MEVTQFTYFQQVGGFDCRPVSGELTYGLERLAMYVQGVENVYDLDFNGQGVTTARSSFRPSGNIRPSTSRSPTPSCCSASSRTWSAVRADPRARPGAAGLRPVLKASHLFNLMDARGAISVTERAGYIGRVRALAKACAEAGSSARQAAWRMAELLLELFSEEIPARMQARAASDLAQRAAASG